MVIRIKLLLKYLCGLLIDILKRMNKFTCFLSRTEKKKIDKLRQEIQNPVIRPKCLVLLVPVTGPADSYTAVSTKVVPQKRKSVRDNADWYYG